MSTVTMKTRKYNLTSEGVDSTTFTIFSASTSCPPPQTPYTQEVLVKRIPNSNPWKL